jgi:TrmH family RNA methyltransferase
VKLLTLARDLRRRRARERQGLFVVEGVRAVEELLRSRLRIEGVLMGPQLAGAQRGQALIDTLAASRAQVTEVSERDFGSAAETDSPQGVLAIAEIPAQSLADIAVEKGTRLLVLDGVQDPGNTGTILRTAAALGVAATLALPGTVDLWNAKVVRSAMGAQFHYPAFSVDWASLDAFVTQYGIELWAADAHGESLGRAPSVPDRLALIVGNEGAGLSAETRARTSRLVSLPMSDVVESINVAVATGILLYELRA